MHKVIFLKDVILINEELPMYEPMRYATLKIQIEYCPRYMRTQLYTAYDWLSADGTWIPVYTRGIKVMEGLPGYT